VDSRFSPLNGLQDVLRQPALDLHTGTAAARVRVSRAGRGVEALEAIREDGTELELRADHYVLAAGGFENPGILLRSGLGPEATGRYLFDHAHRTLLVSTRRDVGTGRGSSLSTGASEAFRDGAFRARRSGAYVSLHNPGIDLTDDVVRGLLAGRDGRDLHRRTSERWRRTLAFDVLLEDRPRPDRRVRLARSRDAFGLPRLSISYPGPSSYERSGWRKVREELERRLRPLGVTSVEERVGPAGSHQLGTCRMSEEGDGVVDARLRHRELPNLRVLGGSAFPTYTPVHPTLTAAALAIRLGEELARS
jgi:choline dehydrogenase-like flavoprotein